MAADNDLKDQALNSTCDFYDLLGVAASATESELRRAYRKTALKYHPDKVGNDQAALDKFHLLSIAYEVLLDQDVRQLYDNARRAREEKKERDAAYEGRRKALKEELELRESAGVAGFKRKREEAQEEEAFQRELKRLAADGARRRKEREEMLRKEAAEEQQRERGVATEAEAEAAATKPAQTNGERNFSDEDRSVKLRWLPEAQITTTDLESRFKRFGKIQDTVINSKPKKLKVDGEKHRKEYMTALIIFENVVAASMAVREGTRLAKEDSDRADWGVFECIDWLSEKEPEGLPKNPLDNPSSSAKEKAAYNRWLFTEGLKKKTLPSEGKPSFGSFKKKST